MGEEVNAAVWGLLGTLVGAATSIGTTWLANAHSAKLEAQKARDQQGETARAFQRQTLIDLQDAIQDLMRQVTSAHHFYFRSVRAGLAWGHEPIPDNLSEAIRETFRKVAILKQRVANQPLREQVSKFTVDVAEVLRADDAEGAERLWRYAMTEHESMSNSVGAVLRSYYVQE